MKTKKIIYLLSFLPLGLLFSCSSGTKDTENQEVEKIKVTTTKANLQEVEQLSTYTATVKAEVVNQITPSIPGRIEKIHVEIGDRVSRGQVLVQMETYSVQQQKTQLINLQRDYERYDELLKVGGIAQQQVDAIKTQISVLESAIRNLEENTRLKSPISGIITDRGYDNGDVFSGVKPILTVQQMNPLKVVIRVSESDFTQVKSGMPVNISFDVYGNEIFTGKVSLIHPTIDQTTHTFGVEITISNNDMRIRPGMFARVTLNFGTRKSIVIPDMAVEKQAGSNDKYVFSIVNGVAKYNKVELGQRLGAQYEVLSGLKDGDTVVKTGQSRLIDGSLVEILSE